MEEALNGKVVVENIVVDGFRAHGEQIAWIEGSLLVTVVDLWNVEMAKASQAALAEMTARLASKGPWVSVVVFKTSLSTSMEVLDEGRSQTAKAAEAGLKAIAFVAAPGVEAKALSDIYADKFSDVVPVSFFENIESAKAWAASILQAAVAKGPL